MMRSVFLSFLFMVRSTTALTTLTRKRKLSTFT